MDDGEIILSNLHASEEKSAREWEIRLSHLADLASHLAPLYAPDSVDDENPMESAFTGIHEETLRLRDRILRACLSVERPAIGRALDGESYRAIAELCRLICGKSGAKSEDLVVQRIERARIAYFPTALSERAWRAISSELPMSTATPFDSFAAACEEVYSGRFDFCILPRSGSDEGILLPFFRLARRYELSSVLAVDVRSGDDSVTRLHLCGSRLIRTRAADRLDLCLHLSFDRLWAILSGIHQLGAVCENLTALPESIFGEDACLLSLRIGRMDPEAILLYLSLCIPAYSVGGIYKLLTVHDKSEFK